MGKRGSEKDRWLFFHHGWKMEEGEIIAEMPITIYVNGVEFVTVMGTPLHQNWLAVGFLMNERILTDLNEIEDLRVTPNGCCVDLWLSRTVRKPDKTIITSGCGGGVTYDDPSLGIEPFQDHTRTTPARIQWAFNHLQSKDSLYARASGVHAAGLLDPEADRLLMVVEDVGRHNTIDKIRGACELSGIPLQGNVLLTTGRISSEMLRKGALMGCPVIASRTSPTSLAVKIARAWGVTLVGYARHGKLRVYSSPERLGKDQKLV